MIILFMIRFSIYYISILINNCRINDLYCRTKQSFERCMATITKQLLIVADYYLFISATKYFILQTKKYIFILQCDILPGKPKTPFLFPEIPINPLKILYHYGEGIITSAEF